MTVQYNPGKHHYQPSRIHAGCGVSWPVYAGGGEFRCCGKPEVAPQHYANVHDEAIEQVRGSIARYEASYADHDNLIGKTADDLQLPPQFALYAKHVVKGEGRQVARLGRLPWWRRVLRWATGVERQL